MALSYLILLVAVLGLILYLFNTQIPVPQWVKVVINVLAVVFVMIYLLQLVGFVGPFPLRLK